jgi:hypothetical protein
VTPGHLQAVQASVANLAVELEDETLTQGQRIDAIQGTVRDMEPVIVDVKRRAEEIGTGLWGVAKANPVEAVMSIAGLIAGAVFTTDKKRNAARKKRNEPV